LYYYKYLKLKRIVVAGAHQASLNGVCVIWRLDLEWLDEREYSEDQIDRYDRAAGLDIQAESQGLVDIQIPYIS
jgi:hypothetical protein